MAENLARYGPGPRPLKIGKSFEKKNPGIFHGIRYDFKPVSVDEERDGVLEVKENNSVAVSLPHVNGSGITHYKGHKSMANTKECILIIDDVTGEFTIERLSSQIQLKKTRPEKIDKSMEQQRPEPDKLLAQKGASESQSARPGGEAKRNPYEVRKVPEKPPGHSSRDMGSSQRGRKQSQSKEDSDFCLTPLHSAKSSPVRQTMPNVQVDMLGRHMSSSSSSSDSSDEDFDDPPKVCVPEVGSMPSLLSQDFSSVTPQKRGVLPTPRPEPHKSSDSPKGRSKPMPSVAAPTNILLGDDLALSDSD